MKRHITLMLWAFLPQQSDLNDNVHKLIEQLKSDSVEERNEATRRLRKLGSVTVPMLEESMKGADSETKLRISTLLRILPSLRVVGHVVFATLLNLDDRITAVLGQDGRVAYSYRRNDHEYVVAAGRTSRQFDRVHSLCWARNSNLAYVGVTESVSVLMLGDKTVFEGTGSIEPPIVLSADGSRIACKWKDGGKSAVLECGERGPVFEQVSTPVFSPDGNQLAYKVKTNGGQRVVMRKWLSPSFPVVSDPLFSPSTNELIYGASDPLSAMGFISRGQNVERISAERVDRLAISDDGKNLAYTLNRKGKQSIVLGNAEYDADGSIVGPLRFTHDGARLAYICVDNRGWHVVCGKESGESFKEINWMSLQITSDNREVAYEATDGDCWFVVVGNTRGLGFSMVRSLVCSSDGNRIAYEANEGGRVTEDGEVSGGKWCLVVNDRRSESFDEVWSPSFSSDGRKVSFCARQGLEMIRVTVEPE